LVHQGDVEEAGLEPASFDLICLNGTIEHLRDPMRIVRYAARLLRIGGLLLVTTLDIEGRLGYFSWKPPEHLFYFSAATLERLLKRAGFLVEAQRTCWRSFGVSDLAARLWGFWGLAGATTLARGLEAIGLGRLSVSIPTNEMLMIARRI
jgi:SAM-dependent methyltransferase